MKYLSYLAKIYFLVVGASIIVNQFVLEHETLERGCYLAADLIIYPACSGFWGAGLVEFILSMPLLLLYVPVFGAMSLSVGGFLFGIGSLLFGIVLWSPLFFLIWRASVNDRAKHNKDDEQLPVSS